MYLESNLTGKSTYIKLFFCAKTYKTEPTNNFEVTKKEDKRNKCAHS